jgi:hypothetical protein
MRPGWKRADQNNNQDDDQNGSEHRSLPINNNAIKKINASRSLKFRISADRRLGARGD